MNLIDEEYVPEPVPESTSNQTDTVQTCIDGNQVEIMENVIPSSNRIKINITKPVKPQPISTLITTIPTRITPGTHIVLPDEYDHSDILLNSNNGEIVIEKEQEIEFEFKEQLKNVKLNKVETTKNGYETSGLCSIM